MKKITLLLTLLLVATVSFGQETKQKESIVYYNTYIQNKHSNPVSQNSYIKQTIENLKHK